MGKNKARHILHGVLDCLPIILIPIFMIYSQNHEINDNSITINESYWEVQNKYETNEVNSLNDLQINHLYNINYIYFITTELEEFQDFTIRVVNYETYYLYSDTRVVEDIINIHEYNANNDNYLELYISYSDYITVSYTNENAYIKISFEDSIEFELENFDFYIPSQSDLVHFRAFINDYNYSYQSELLPNKSDFQVLEYVYHENTPVVYDDTDIMSQSFYCLYNSVDKYFNMGNVFGMQNLYTWFETNIFGGTASPSIYIVWNIVLYEFVMDLLFLLYGLFMFFIDLCKRLMEKPLNSIK